ncbi:MAG: mraZ [Opitutaceae bacterium]
MAPIGNAAYTGLFRHTLDDKGRLTIPSEWRGAHAADETFLATPHPDGYIAVLPPDEVANLRAKIAAQRLSDSEAQKFAARFFSKTQSFSYDKTGRAGFTPELLKHAGIEKDAVLVGSMTKFNIYSPARWTQEDTPADGASFGDVMRKLGI